MRVDDATEEKERGKDQREARTSSRKQLVVGQEQRLLVAGEQRGKQQKRSWRGRMEGQSTPDTEQRGEETR